MTAHPVDKGWQVGTSTNPGAVSPHYRNHITPVYNNNCSDFSDRGEGRRVGTYQRTNPVRLPGCGQLKECPMVDYKQQALENRKCPECLSAPGEACWSRLWQQPMVNEVHKERMRKA